MKNEPRVLIKLLLYKSVVQLHGTLLRYATGRLTQKPKGYFASVIN